MHVVDTPLDRLIPYARNPRLNAEAIDTVAASLAEFGWRQPIVVAPDMVIVVGHTRYEAAKRLGMTSVAVHVAEGLTPAQLRAYRLMDNRSNQNASWDNDLLRLELADLKIEDFDLGLTGYDDDELARLLAETPADGLTDADAIPPPPAVPVTRRGDLWLLGGHRLLCGDATSHDDVARLMARERAALFATDPPYLVDYDGTNHPVKVAGRDTGRTMATRTGRPTTSSRRIGTIPPRGRRSTRRSCRPPSMARSATTLPGTAGTPRAARRCWKPAGRSSTCCTTSRSSG
jgi:ParB-like chromosome segregation protein Spo0J